MLKLLPYLPHAQGYKNSCLPKPTGEQGMLLQCLAITAHLTRVWAWEAQGVMGAQRPISPSLLLSSPFQLRAWGCGGEEVGALARWLHGSPGVAVPDLSNHGAGKEWGFCGSVSSSTPHTPCPLRLPSSPFLLCLAALVFPSLLLQPPRDPQWWRMRMFFFNYVVLLTV